MKTITLLALIAASSLAGAQAEPLSAEEIWQKLISPDATDAERTKLLKDLPEGTRKRLRELEKRDEKILEKRAAEEKKQYLDLLLKGTGNLLDIGHYYEQAAKAAIKNSQADSERDEITRHSEKTLQRLNLLIHKNTPQNNLAIWKSFEATSRHLSKNPAGSEVTPAQLTTIEEQFINPLLKTLEKDVSASPSQTKSSQD